MKGTPPASIAQWRYMQRMSYRPSPGHTVVCCPGNLARALPTYISRMWMADRRDNGLAAVLYGPCLVTHRVGRMNEEVRIETRTDYPYSDRIEMRLTCAREITFPMHVRIPGWCRAPELRINDRPVSLEPRNGFVTIRRTWQPSDVIHLHLPMDIRLSRWPEDGVAIERGPLVYALPIEQRWTRVDDERSSPQFPAWDLTPEGAWNYALLPDLDPAKLRFESNAPSDDPWMNPPSSISISAREVAGWQLVNTEVNGEPATLTPPLPDPALLSQQLRGPARPLKLVPYASTELRIAVFPRAKV